MEWLFYSEGNTANNTELWALGDLSLLQYIYKGAPPRDIALAIKTFLKIWTAKLKQIHWLGRQTKGIPLWVGALLPQVVALSDFEGLDRLGVSTL